MIMYSHITPYNRPMPLSKYVYGYDHMCRKCVFISVSIGVHQRPLAKYCPERFSTLPYKINVIAVIVHFPSEQLLLSWHCSILMLRRNILFSPPPPSDSSKLILPIFGATMVGCLCHQFTLVRLRTCLI